MVMNLQYFGGRGSSSGFGGNGIVAFDVDLKGGKSSFVVEEQRKVFNRS